MKTILLFIAICGLAVAQVLTNAPNPPVYITELSPESVWFWNDAKRLWVTTNSGGVEMMYRPRSDFFEKKWTDYQLRSAFSEGASAISSSIGVMLEMRDQGKTEKEISEALAGQLKERFEIWKRSIE